MRGEYDAAAAEGAELDFALGCLVAALGEVPRHARGRLALADHMLAIAMLVPVACLQFFCAVSLVAPFAPAHGLYDLPVAGSAEALFFADVYLAGQPVRFLLWLMLGACNLRLAWLVLERDRNGVVRAASLVAAVTLTLVIFDAVLLLIDGRALLQAGSLLLELAAISLSLRWHAGLLSQNLPEHAD